MVFISDHSNGSALSGAGASSAPSASIATQAAGGNASQDDAVSKIGMTPEQQKAAEEFENYHKYDYKKPGTFQDSDSGSSSGGSSDSITVLEASPYITQEIKTAVKESGGKYTVKSGSIGVRQFGDVIISEAEYQALHPYESQVKDPELSGIAAVHSQSLQRQENLTSQGDYLGAYKESVNDKRVISNILDSQTITATPNSPKVTLTEELRTDPIIGDAFTLVQTSLFTADGEFKPLPLIGNETDLQNAYSERRAGYEKLEGGNTGRGEQMQQGAIDIAVTAIGAPVIAAKVGSIPLLIPKMFVKAGKTAATIEGVGTLAHIGGEVPGVTEFTTDASSGLKTLSAGLISSDNMLTKIGGIISAPFLGVASGAITGAGAIPSALAGAGKIATGNTNLKELKTAGANTAIGFANYVKEGATTNPLFTAGELGAITGAAGKGAKVVSNKRENNLVRKAQGDIEASFAESVGVDGTAAKDAFMAAGDALKVAEKINVPLKNAQSTNLKELTMFSDLSDAEAKTIDTILAEGNAVSYGTSSNVAYGLNFRKSSDYDASIPESAAETTISKLSEVLEPYGGKREASAGDSWQITRPAPESGIEAHAFDLHRLDADTAIGKLLDDSASIDNNAAAGVSTSTFERIPGTVNKYKTITPAGSNGVIFIEPLQNAYSRKYAATFFPRTDATANLKDKVLIPPKSIQYETKINPDIYTKNPNLPDLQTPITKTVNVKGFSFTVARVRGTAQNVGAKLKASSLKESGDITKRINYPLELSDSHRMKDALDLIGITWEYKTHLIRDNVKNPVKKAAYQRRVDRSLNRMLKDQVIRTQVKRGAASKLSELSPEFAGFLKDNGILSDGQLNRVKAANTKGQNTAFTTGTPDIGKLTGNYLKEYNSPKSGSNAKGSPYSIGGKPSPYKPGKPSPYKPGSHPKPYKATGTAAPYGSTAGSPGYNQPGKVSPYNYGSYPVIGNAAKSQASIVEVMPSRITPLYDPKKARKKSDKKLRTDLFAYSAARTGRIDHLSIVDPAEFMSWGSMTNRNKADMTLSKKKLYIVDNAITTKKPEQKEKGVLF